MMRQLLLFDDIIPPMRCGHDEAMSILRRLSEQGNVIGTDEAGRGALAGSVVAAAVCLTQSQEASLLSLGLRDSKRLSPKRRESLFAAMRDLRVTWRAFMGSVERVDRDNVLNASLWTMGEAVSRVARVSDGVACVIVDGNESIPGLDIPQWVLVKADDVIPCVSAASIVAKVIRDRLMVKLSAEYPGYFLEQNKGYPTQAHIQALGTLGMSSIHRRTFCRKFLHERGSKDADNQC